MYFPLKFKKRNEELFLVNVLFSIPDFYIKSSINTIPINGFYTPGGLLQYLIPRPCGDTHNTTDPAYGFIQQKMISL